MNSTGYEGQPVPRYEESNGARLQDKAEEARPQRRWSQAQCILVSLVFHVKRLNFHAKAKALFLGAMRKAKCMFTFEKARVEPLHGSRSRVANKHG